MEIPTEQKINMSLEDLIKSKQQASHEKRNKNNKNSGEKIKKPAPAVKPNPATNTRNRRSNRVAAKQNTATNKTPASTQAAKVAKSVAASKANRAANINEKRGMPGTILFRLFKHTLYRSLFSFSPSDYRRIENFF